MFFFRLFFFIKRFREWVAPPRLKLSLLENNKGLREDVPGVYRRSFVSVCVGVYEGMLYCG